MEFIENLREILTVNVLYDLGIFLAIGIIGAIVAFIFGALANKYIQRKLIGNWIRKRVPQMSNYYSTTVKIMIIVFQVFIILFFFSMAAELLELELLSKLILSSFSLLPQITIALIIFVLGITLSKIVASRVSKLNIENASTISFFTEFVIIYATILTTLEFFSIKATPFFEIFRVILYVGGVILALSVGIPVGMSIKENMDSKDKKKK